MYTRYRSRYSLRLTRNAFVALNFQFLSISAFSPSAILLYSCLLPCFTNMIYVTNLFFFHSVNTLYGLYSCCLQDMCSYEISRFQKASKSFGFVLLQID